MDNKTLQVIDNINEDIKINHTKKIIIDKNKFYENIGIEVESNNTETVVCKYCESEFWGFGKKTFSDFCCDELEAAIGKDKKEMLIEAVKTGRKHDKIVSIYNKLNFNKRFMKRTFKNFIPDNNKQSFVKMKEYVDNYRDNFEKGIGFIILGSSGAGKTHLMSAVLHAIIRKHLEENIMYGKFKDFLDQMQMSYELGDGESFRIMEKMASVNIFAIEDFGRERSSEWAQSSIFHTLDTRYEKMLPTFYTSNNSLSGLVKQIDASVVSRIVQTSVVVNLSSGNIDKRLQGVL